MQPTGLSSIYADWQSACADATGYDTSAVIEKTASAAEKVKLSNGRLFERDGVLFDYPIAPYPFIKSLLCASAKHTDGLTVIDFGGSLGSTYRQCLPFLSHIRILRWNVVELPGLVKVGRSKFENDTLRFFGSLDDASSDRMPDIFIFSGVLQYLDDPYAILEQAKALAPAAILIDRNPCSILDRDAFTLQTVPDRIFSARFPFRIFGHDEINRALTPQYCLSASFETVDRDMQAGDVVVKFRGQYFNRR